MLRKTLAFSSLINQEANFNGQLDSYLLEKCCKEFGQQGIYQSFTTSEIMADNLITINEAIV